MAGGSEPIWMSVWRGRRRETREPFTFVLFQCGGAGARAIKDGLSTTGFPSGVAGVPAEVFETLSPCVQYRRELRTDSGGAGTYRGGQGQWTEDGCRTDEAWTVSGMVDRTKFPGQGLEGGASGALGQFQMADGTPQHPKSLITLEPEQRIQLNGAGGGGYGDPMQRSPELVLDDVVNGYVSLESAERDYGVCIRYVGESDRLVRLPDLYRIDWDRTQHLRGAARAT
jgi:N-methylhydantoinase B